MEIELVFHEKYMIHRTRFFYEIVDDNIVLTNEGYIFFQFKIGLNNFLCMKSCLVFYLALRSW
jgi:hypothetical protein